MDSTTVGIMTNLDAKCGNAEYARDLARTLGKYYKIEMGPYANMLSGSSVVIVNWHPARINLDRRLVDSLHEYGRKVIIVIHNSFDWEFATSDVHVFRYADAIIAHEPMNGDVRVRYIPHGIPVVENLPETDELRIGVAGFPFDWKRFDVVAKAAIKLGARCRLIGSRYDTVDTEAHMQQLAGWLGDKAEIYREYMPTETVVRLLAQCTMNIFWFESKTLEDQLGQTGSARMGIAAQRPMIISRHRKFRTLLPYEEDFYVADTEEQVYEHASEIAQSLFPKKPTHSFQEMNWHIVGEKFRDLIEEVAA